MEHDELTEKEHAEIREFLESDRPYEPLPTVEEMEVLIANRREVCR